jgi:hypothetical protein
MLTRFSLPYLDIGASLSVAKTSGFSTKADTVAISAGCVIKVRGFKKVPFKGEDIASMQVTHKTWSFREASDGRSKNKVAAA